MAHGVVMSLLSGMHRKGDVMVIDNYFSNVGLFMELANFETYTISTMKAK